MSTTTSSYPSQLYHHQSLYSSRDSSSGQHPSRTEPSQLQPQQPSSHHHHHLQQHPSFLRKDIYGSGKSSSSLSSYPDSSEPLSPMTDSAVHQQSKRLAGMSITNSSGNKVSILNDSPLDLEKASIKSEREYGNRAPPPIHSGGNGHPPPPPPAAVAEYGLPPLRSPHSPHYRDHRRDYFADDRKDPYYYPATASAPSSHRQRSDSYEQGRSTSLTNAATPFRSGFDARSSESNSQRSRSLSSSAQLYPYSSSHGGHHHHHHHHHHHGYSPSSSPASSSPFAGTGASPLPFFMRAYSEDGAGSDEHESGPSAAYRGLMVGHPGLPEGLLTGPSFSKRKYSCTHPGCNKRFTTSGHLARHNRIHTGERNFSCLMPGCPSKFSRQDNMMQHYRTHISPKSRRGANAKKLDPLDGEISTGEGTGAGASESELGDQEQLSPSSAHPRYYPSEQETESMDQDDPVSPSVHSSHGSFATRDHHHQQHHSSSHQERNWSVPASPTSPMARVAADRMEDVITSSAPSSTSSSSSSSLSSSTSVSSSSSSAHRDQQLFYYRQQQQYQQHYQQRQMQKQAASHASAYYHAAAATQSQGHNHSSKHMASPSSEMRSYPHSHMHLSTSSSSGGRGMMSGSNSRTPPSPQSTPVTPTKYRFDPIQDCLQQERRQREEATL